MQYSLKTISTALLSDYRNTFDDAVETCFNDLKESEIATASFNFYSSVAAVFSSKIEGENIALDDFIKHQLHQVSYQPDYTRKIDDLYEAYQFAASNALNFSNLKLAHSLITKHILKTHQQGVLRSGNMFVVAGSGKIEYVAAAPHLVAEYVELLFEDINFLLNTKLTFAEVLFFASMVHLVFVKIHPFNDGNGRTARLLEKWFLAEKLGAKAWFVESERYYHEHYDLYFANIRKLGLEYDQLNYLESQAFTLMLPTSIIRK
ncbi:MAG: Fic family protein [Chitinophagales bacterium]